MKAKLIEWTADILYGALRLFLGRVHDWIFDPIRQANIRFGNRQRWWKYKCKADATKDPRDNMRAEAWRIQFNFEVSPREAVRRGDLDPAARKLAMDAVEKARMHP